MATHSHPNRAAGTVALFGFMAASFAVWIYYGNGQRDLTAAATAEPLTIATRSGLQTFAVEMARTPEQQATGLMFRTKLADGAGMLFVHGAPRELRMWMKNTFIPLDMLFIRADGVVHRIEANTQPMSEAEIASGGPVAAVLEIAGGAAARRGIAAGDQVRHAAFDQR